MDTQERDEHIAERAIDEEPDVATFADRYGFDCLVETVNYARDYKRGEVTHRIMARELDMSPVEAGIILDALRDYVDD